MWETKSQTNKIILCLNCSIRPAIAHPTLGWLVCKPCQNKLHPLPKTQSELPGEQIKEQRKMFKKEMIQPWNRGELSKEYLDQYGSKGIKATQEEIRNAKNVWTGDPVTSYYD